MRSKLMSVLTVIGAVTVLVLAANTVALATTGKAILAGKINTASKMTSITRTTSGTALQVKTKSTTNAPFAVNGRGKVANLNADTVDGLQGSTLQNRPYLYRLPNKAAASTISYSFPGLPAGKYLATISVYGQVSQSNTTVQCSLSNGTGEGPLVSISSNFYFGQFPSITNAGYVDVTAATTLGCSTDPSKPAATFTAFADSSQVTFTRIDAVSTRTAVGRLSTAAR